MKTGFERLAPEDPGYGLGCEIVDCSGSGETRWYWWDLGKFLCHACQARLAARLQEVIP